MKAAVLTIDGFEIREIEKPSAGDDEILIQTSGCGICSGDLFVYKNRAMMAGTNSRLGHEGSGIVAAAGRNTVGFAIGDVVTALEKQTFAEYFVTKPEKLVKLSPEVDPAYVLGEAIACCIHASNRFGTKPGDRVAIVGCGFMGLVCLQLAKYQGAGLICALDPVDYRLEMSRQFGAYVTLNPYEQGAEEILQQCGEFDVVIEAAGTQKALDLSTSLVKQRGRMILVGYHQSHGGVRTVNMQQWNYKAIDVVNGHVRRQDEKAEAMHQGMELMGQGHISTKPMVTVYGLADTERAFRDLVDGKPGLIKVVILMGK